MSFTEPWLFGTPTSAGIDVFDTRRRYNEYTEKRRGTSLRLGRPFPWLDYTHAYWRYSLAEYRIEAEPGYEDEIGAAAGKGTNWNVPLPPGTTQDRYLSALETLLERLSAYDPHWLIVSAGFDTYVRDPISTFQVTTAGFYAMGQHIHALDKPTLVVQEGGYYVPDLGLNVVTFLKGLGG